MYLDGAVASELKAIPDGKKGILDTLKVMAKLARAGSKSYAVIQRATSITRGCEAKDLACRIKSIHAYVRDGIQYQLDPVDLEMVQSPEVTMQRAAGDCDDQSVLVAALLMSLGIQARFIAIGFTPNVYEHVYTEAKCGTVWIPLETTERVEAGWNPADNSPVRAYLPHYI